MEVPVAELVREFVQEARVPPGNEEEDVFLQGLIDDFQSSSALFKRDMRRRLEKDPPAFLRSACRLLRANSRGPGAAYVMELLWSNPVLVASLIDPVMLPLRTAIAFAKRWYPFDPMLDIKLLHIGFPSEDGGVHDVDILRARRALAIVNELPANRHILLPLVNLLSSPDASVRSKAATIYGRTSQNPEWVRKRLGETDARVRANAVESLWGADSDSAKAVLKEASRDRHHRVAVNALIGLHRSGAVDAAASLKKMAQAPDPMARAAAAFAMGEILKDEFKPVLESLLKDSSANVRGRALASLIRLRRHRAQEIAREVASLAPEEDEPPEQAQEEKASAPPDPETSAPSPA
jgi:hypothetical protein